MFLAFKFSSVVSFMHVQDREALIGSCLTKTDNNLTLLTLSTNGALHCFKRDEEFKFGLKFKAVKLEWYICRHCLHIFKNIHNAREHIDNVHIGPAKCSMCGEVKEDILDLRFHKQMCGYACGVNGCNLHHKTIESAQHHMKQFNKTMI